MPWKSENQIFETQNRKFIQGNCDSHLIVLQRTLGISTCTRDTMTIRNIRLDTTYWTANMSGLLHMNAMHVENNY